MATTFSEATRKLLDGKNFAVLATINADGGPQSSVVWFERDGDTVLLSATTARLKVRNIVRDPRVSLTVYDLADPYDTVTIRGTATVTADPERVQSLRLSHRYVGQDPPAEPEDVERVVVRITPTKVTEFKV
ncbi:PPOX class F420-dependent oxidoreductase [Actinophytocola sp.]|jgi:PPOX class probable F420-dependent enzyme|uniref:PPOX class F420-dependent oxidoreductase n=1 Tax=Actinophytocola sp. TaxID=1872138 RepID=UPI002ED9978E